MIFPTAEADAPRRAARANLRRWTDCLMDPDQPDGFRYAAAQEWYRWMIEAGGIDDAAAPVPENGQFRSTRLPSGRAISAVSAARCLWEAQRTAVFLRAVNAAVRRARERFPGETIHVVEAGCGPAAPLSLPFAVRYPADEVVFTLMDIHPLSLATAQRLAEALGVQASIRRLVAGDAAMHRFAEADRPHVIVAEVLQRALSKEPQVAVTRNLAPQLRPGGFFLPERIDVHAALYDGAEHFKPPTPDLDARAVASRGLQDLGRVFSLDPGAPVLPPPERPDELPAGAVRVPPHSATRTPLRLMTRLRVFEEHELGDFASSLNLPERVRYPDELAARGGVLRFAYQLTANPGLRIVASELDATA